MYKFTIDRGEWLNGNILESLNSACDNFDSCLYNPTLNKKCCLGILLSPFFTDEEMEYTRTPRNLLWYVNDVDSFISNLSKDAQDMFNNIYNDPETSRLLNINDSYDFTLEQREEELTKSFAKLDIEVDFVGEYDLVV